MRRLVCSVVTVVLQVVHMHWACHSTSAVRRLLSYIMSWPSVYLIEHRHASWCQDAHGISSTAASDIIMLVHSQQQDVHV